MVNDFLLLLAVVLLVFLHLGVHPFDLYLVLHDFRVQLLDLLVIIVRMVLVFLLDAIPLILKLLNPILYLIVDLLFILKLIRQVLDLLGFCVILLLYVL